MASLLLVVFLLQLIIHTVNSVDAGILSEYVWQVLCLLPTNLPQALRDNQKYANQVIQLKAAIGKVSAQDDFARWAKLQRQLDKASAAHEKAASRISSAKAKIKPVISGLRFLVFNALRFLIPWWYTKTPMFWLPQGWVPYYVEWIVSFPRAPLGSVSIQTWAMACASIILLFTDALYAFKKLLNDLLSAKNASAPSQSGSASQGQREEKDRSKVST